MAAALIVLAGPAVNFILAVLIFMGFLLAFGQSYTPPVAAQVVVGSAADKAGLKAGDKVVVFNGTEIESFEQLVGQVIMIPKERATIILERSGARIEKQIMWQSTWMLIVLGMNTGSDESVLVRENLSAAR